MADADVVGALTADVLESSADSSACNNGSAPSQTNDSQVIALNDTGVPVPADGCADGTPNTEFTPLNPLLSAVCNADDTNGSQTSSPYGVREALSAFVLAVLDDSAVAKATTAASESHAVAPAGPGTSGTPGTPGGGNGGNGGNGGGGNGAGNGPNGDNGDNGGNGEGAGAADVVSGNGPSSLAFTGSDLLVLGLLGAALLLGGLMLTAAHGRPRHTAS